MAEMPHAIADPITPMRIDRRRPWRSASAVANKANNTPMRVNARAKEIVAFDAWKARLMGSANWPNSAAANETVAVASDAVASKPACVLLKATGGSPITVLGGSGGG